MLLNELTGVKAYKDSEASQILMTLKKEYGIDVKHGSFGLVLTHPAWKHVLKVFPKDDCYLDFVEYCRKHPNQHLPTFTKPPIKMSVFFKNNIHLEKFFAVKLEKLERLESEQVTTVTTLSRDADVFLSSYQRVPDKDKFLSERDLADHRDLVDVMVELKQFSHGGCYIDFHKNNFMRRADTIVIIDPYADKLVTHDIPLRDLLSDEEMKDISPDELAATLDSMVRQFTVPLVRNTLPLK